MMTTKLFLLLLAAGTAFSLRSAPNSTWTCSSLTAEHDFELNQVLGQWYLVESISPLSGRTSTCAGLKFLNPDDSSWNNITMVGHETTPLGDISYNNQTVIIPDPVNHKGFWELRDIGAVLAVTDVGANNDTIALTTCHLLLQYDWTGVFSRSSNINSTVLNQINERLISAGLQNVDSATIVNTTSCPIIA